MRRAVLPRQDYNAPWHPVVVGNWAEMAVLLPRQDPQGLPSPVAATMISALPFFHCRQTLTDGFISMPAIECVFGSLRAFCVHESSHFALCLDTECVGGCIGSFCVQLIVHRVPNSSCPTPAGHLKVTSGALIPFAAAPFAQRSGHRQNRINGNSGWIATMLKDCDYLSGRKRDVPVSVGSGRKRERKMSFRFG